MYYHERVSNNGLKILWAICGREAIRLHKNTDESRAPFLLYINSCSVENGEGRGKTGRRSGGKWDEGKQWAEFFVPVGDYLLREQPGSVKIGFSRKKIGRGHVLCRCRQRYRLCVCICVY